MTLPTTHNGLGNEEGGSCHARCSFVIGEESEDPIALLENRIPLYRTRNPFTRAEIRLDRRARVFDGRRGRWVIKEVQEEEEEESMEV